MPAFFDLLEKETEPSVRAVLGHWLFGYIHPYPDGNGRMGPFPDERDAGVGGYPWTVIRVRDRNAYLAALDRVSIDMDIKPFTTLIAQRARWLCSEVRAGLWVEICGTTPGNLRKTNGGPGWT